MSGRFGANGRKETEEEKEAGEEQEENQNKISSEASYREDNEFRTPIRPGGGFRLSRRSKDV